MPVLTGLGSHRSRQVDQLLEQAALDLLAHDDRMRRMRVRVTVDGGVAHVTGAVADPGELLRLRTLLARMSGIHAVWDRVEVAGVAPRLVELGPGDVKQYAESVGLDVRPGKGVDVLADLNRPLPLRDGSVDRIFAVHVLEHLSDLHAVMNECHRALREHGVLHVMVPYWRHVNAVTDPTHVRFFDTQTFKPFCVTGQSDRCWRPLSVSMDGASVLADLVPVKGDVSPADEASLAWFFE